MSYRRDWRGSPTTSEPNMETSALWRELDHLREDHQDHEQRLRTLERPRPDTIPEAVRSFGWRAGLGLVALLGVRIGTGHAPDVATIARLFGLE